MRKKNSIAAACVVLAAVTALSIPAGAAAGEGATVRGKSGLEWLSNAGTPSVKGCPGGKKSWQEAADYVSCLNANAYLDHTDWRLPTEEELGRLFKHRGGGHSLEPAGPRLNKAGFSNVQSSMYWSANRSSEETALAVYPLTGGKTYIMGVATQLYVWPVRGVPRQGGKQAAPPAPAASGR